MLSLGHPPTCSGIGPEALPYGQHEQSEYAQNGLMMPPSTVMVSFGMHVAR